jgi:glycosyltransferase involved in cell wall biosynthesis
LNRKPSIAFFGIKYFPARGGTSRVAENLIRNMVEDYSITVYCYRHNDAKYHIEGVNVVQFPEIKLGSLGVFIYFLLCCLHIQFKANYDVIHAHKIDSFFFLKYLPKKAKVIATAHEAPYNRDKWGRVAKWFFKLSERRFLRFNGVKTAISKPLCDFYKEQFNTDILFLPNGINLDDRSHSGASEIFWPKNVPNDCKFVLFAARRIMGTKGLHTMLEAYKKIDYQGHIFVAGELDNFPTYIKQVKKLSKGMNVSFLGFVNPLPALLELVDKSDYFVFPSETEGMSIMLLEVASVGKPILASDIPENTQVFDKNEVLFFENKNVEDLVEKIEWLTKNTAKFQALGKNAKKKVATRYTWNNIAIEYKALYEA